MNAPAHVERVVKRLREHRLNPRPHQIDKDRWDGYCPVCGGELVLRDVSWDEFGLRRVMLFCECDEEKIVGALALQDRSLYGQEEDADPEREPETLKLSSVTLKDFTDVQEE